MKIWTTRN